MQLIFPSIVLLVCGLSIVTGTVSQTIHAERMVLVEVLTAIRAHHPFHVAQSMDFAGQRMNTV
jgi:hypothetical protein